MSNDPVELESRCVASRTAVEGLVAHAVPAADGLDVAPVRAADAVPAADAAPVVPPASAAEIAQAVAGRPDWAEDGGPVTRPVPPRPPVPDGPFNTFAPAAERPAADVWTSAVQVTGMTSALVAGSHLLDRYARPLVTPGPVVSASGERA